MKWLFLLSLVSSISCIEVPQCCPKNELWNSTLKNCTDGSQLRLNCERGFYILQPLVDPNDKYVFEDIDNKTWLSFFAMGDEAEGYRVPSKSFCATKMPMDEEVVLVCFTDSVDDWRHVFFGLLSIVSSFFLALTLIVYFILPELRNVQDKATMSVTGSFMLAFFLTGIQQLKFSPFGDNTTCLFTAFLMYYCYLSAFFWLNIVSFNIWRMVWFPNVQMQKERLFRYYNIIGWGFPLIFLITTLVTHHVDGNHLQPGFGEVSCWFNGYYATWAYFYGPILALLSMNFIYLGLTSWKLLPKFRSMHCSNIKALKIQCQMYLRLVVMMGCTWMFEVIPFAFAGKTNQLYWILPDLLNVLQGLFIFILLVITRKRVRRLLSQRRPCGIPFPRTWEECQDDEKYESLNIPVEVELSQSS